MNLLKNKILISGGSGFIGKHFLDSVLKCDLFETHIIHRSKTDLKFLKNHKNFYLYNLSELKIQEILQIVKPIIAINFVCSYNNSNHNEMYYSNYEFGKLFVDCCIENKVKFFINTHTLANSANSNYVLTKSLFVKYLIQVQKQINIINISPELVYGNNYHENNLTNYLTNQLRNKKEICIENAYQMRDFIHISDLVTAYNAVISNIKKFNNFTQIDVGTGTLTSIEDFAKLFINIFYKKNIKIVFKTNSVYLLRYNLSQINALKWRPKISLEKGIFMMLDNYKFK
tara:strand:- start:2218 stop:3075 length:858 start_codon:yes stop_codon:yes gene_type:complete